MTSIARRLLTSGEIDDDYTPMFTEHPITAIARRSPDSARDLLVTLSEHRLASNLHHDETLLAIERERGYTSREVERIRGATSITLARIQADRDERTGMIHALASGMVTKIQGDPHRNHYAGEIRERGWCGKGYSMQIHAWD